MLDLGVVALGLHQRDLFEEFVVLAVVGGLVDPALVQESVFEEFEPTLLVMENAVQSRPEVAYVRLTCLPDIQHDRSEQRKVARLRTKAFEQVREA